MSEALPAKRSRSCLGRLFRLTILVIVLVLLTAVLAAVGAYLVYDHATRPGVAGMPVRIQIPEGTSGYGVGKILAGADLIEHEGLFRVALYADTDKGIIKHGTYELPQGLSALELLNRLQEGPNLPFSPDDIPSELKVTVPEGLTLKQIAALFDEPEKFLEAANDPGRLARVEANSASLEGFLMPDTYYFADKPTEAQVVDRMLDHFLKTYEDLEQTHPRLSEQDPIEVVTVASLIEEEARVPEERPIIASVIYNRIEKGIPLGLDSTLQFALGKYGQRLVNSDKDVESPYNTYRNAGLPPGPISCPGRDSLIAAIEPADTKYLYFVSNADGRTHTFSTTFEEHQAAVTEYRRKISVQRRELENQSEK